MNEGTPDVRQTSSNIRATPCASFHGNRYANKKFDVLSTTSNTYPVPPSDVFGNICKSTSSTSHGSRNLAGNMAMRWLRERFLRPPLHDNTLSRGSLHIPGLWNLSRSSENVRATPGWPCWQCTKASRSGTRYCGTASTDVFLTNTPTRSHSSHSKLWSSTKYLFSSASVNPSCSSCPPDYQALAWPCPIPGLLPASRPNDEHIVTTGRHVRSPAILTVVGDVPNLPPSFQDRSLFGHALPLSWEVELRDEWWSLTSHAVEIRVRFLDWTPCCDMSTCVSHSRWMINPSPLLQRAAAKVTASAPEEILAVHIAPG